ncbi:eukaryotic translation initiation factor 3 subunit H-like protein [Syncephalis pseudoplumigaleata]|uniref:Eukaryotic translation initiation factor 3 subunit H n=1 Tax=Syncephalis pseudoplumigaleata TaxID=1712513 RepID=A0A4P9Z2X8_9FUNG|nr:eukaryotic translation initiation factor 3 subunit H-like protein [Syncephalis pseudoplumigaleata]|eukprot:RKP26897.1 eukaryotic translation initiation factor 3 subunit H-like protein [Syncephalis pseudoplumigaleata]
MRPEHLEQDAQVVLDSVQLDGMVVMKIIKHCRERHNGTVTGQLLGLDVDGCLEITNCFPLPQSNKHDDGSSITMYQMDMLRSLRDVNADHNTVGWYQSARHGSFITQSLIETQFDYQKKLGEKCVVLIHDLSSTEKGNFNIRAYRLSKNFMRVFRHRDFTTANMRKLGINCQTIFDELPVKVSNSTLAEVLLDELDTTERPITSDLSRLELADSSRIERAIESLTEGIEDWHHDQGQWLYWLRGAQRDTQRIQQAMQKRKAENKERAAAGMPLLPDEPDDLPRVLPEPSRLDQMLTAHQMLTYSKQMENISGTNITRLYTTKAVQK